MKAKTIRQILKSRVKSLADYVEQYLPDEIEKLAGNDGIYNDPELAKDILAGTIVTGGCIVSMLMKEPVNDYDLYFRDKALSFRVAKFFMWLFARQTGNPMETYIAHRKNTDNLHHWDRHYPTEKNCNEVPVFDRFKIVIKSAGIASTQEEPTDYAYFETRDDEEGSGYVEAVTATDEVSAEMVEAEIEKKGKHHPKFMSGNAITLAGKLQIVTRFWGEPEEIHGNYDFVHCTCYYSSWNTHLELPQAALEAILTKELRYVGSLYPLCSIIRIRKFVARGWHINAGQILKMCMQLNDLKLKDLHVLEDQLTGVDAAYFQQIIERLSTRQEEKIQEQVNSGLSRTEAEKSIGGIDTSYLATIIDRIF